MNRVLPTDGMIAELRIFNNNNNHYDMDYEDSPGNISTATTIPASRLGTAGSANGLGLSGYNGYTGNAGGMKPLSATPRITRNTVYNPDLLDYGIASPILNSSLSYPPLSSPPPLPTVSPPLPQLPPYPQTISSPVTHFPRHISSGLAERDTVRLIANDLGAPAYWQIKTGYPISNGKAMSDSASSSGVVTDISSSSPSGDADSGTMTPIKRGGGSIYSGGSIAGNGYNRPVPGPGMYGMLSESDHHSLEGVRRRGARRPMGSMESLKHRKDDDDKMSGGAVCCLTFLVLIAQILLHGLLALVLYWVIKFHTSDGASFPFAWRDDPVKEFNLHPVLMITGFIYFSGQAMLFYRSCRCCRRIWSKLFHTMFHLLAIPCICVGFIAVLDNHNLRVDQDGRPAPIPNFYSLHSWMGLTTMGLFAIQFIIGFFSFLLLLCCESATASFRANLVPIHSAFGLTTFVLAVATACVGLTEKAFFTLSIGYTKWVPRLLDPRFNTSAAYAGVNTLGPTYTEKMFEESLVINGMGGILICLVLVFPVLILNPRYRYRPPRVITVTHDRYE